jgi:hypothetical protein
MRPRLRNLWSRKPHSHRARLQVEALESREVPTVTYHGGALLQKVEVQAVYYGSDWTGNATMQAQMSQLDNYLSYIVRNPYMLMPDNAGYGVHAGTTSTGVADPISLAANSTVTDGQLQRALQALIGNPPYSTGSLQAPDPNRLYVVFVEDNVAVQRADGSTSQQFIGYHSAFLDTYANPYLYHDIHYVVIPYPGGSVGNANVSGLSAFNTMTLATSRELVNAVTDPDLNYKAKGWYDDNFANPNGTTGAEVAAITNLSTVWLAGYAVQRIADQNDQLMTPWSVGPGRQVHFWLLNNGQLWEQVAPNWRQQVATGVAAVSDQGIDNKGRAFVDYVTTGGVAYELHDGLSPLYLCGGVVQAKAGQAVSYLLLNNGALWEYHDSYSSDGSTAGTWTNPYSSIFIQAIDAGTDKYGVNAVDVLFTTGYAWMHSDTDGWHYLMGNVTQVSGGQMGLVALLDQSGNADMYNEWVGSPTYLTSGVRQVTTGYDITGNWIIGVVLTDASAWLYRPYSNTWTYLTGGVWKLSKENLGVINVLFGGTDASYFDSTGQHPLSSGGTVAVA